MSASYEIKVTPEKLTAAAQDMKNTSTQIQHLTSDMSSAIDSMMGAWSGEAATVFQARFKGIKQDMTDMHNMLLRYTNNLSTIATGYAQTEKKNQTIMSQLQTDVIKD